VDFIGGVRGRVRAGSGDVAVRHGRGDLARAVVEPADKNVAVEVLGLVSGGEGRAVVERPVRLRVRGAVRRRIAVGDGVSEPPVVDADRLARRVEGDGGGLVRGVVERHALEREGDALVAGVDDGAVFAGIRHALAGRGGIGAARVHEIVVHGIGVLLARPLDGEDVAAVGRVAAAVRVDRAARTEPVAEIPAGDREGVPRQRDGDVLHLEDGRHRAHGASAAGERDPVDFEAAAAHGGAVVVPHPGVVDAGLGFSLDRLGQRGRLRVRGDLVPPAVRGRRFGRRQRPGGDFLCVCSGEREARLRAAVIGLRRERAEHGQVVDAGGRDRDRLPRRHGAGERDICLGLLGIAEDQARARRDAPGGAGEGIARLRRRGERRGLVLEQDGARSAVDGGLSHALAPDNRDGRRVKVRRGGGIRPDGVVVSVRAAVRDGPHLEIVPGDAVFRGIRADDVGKVAGVSRNILFCQRRPAVRAVKRDMIVHDEAVARHGDPGGGARRGGVPGAAVRRRQRKLRDGERAVDRLDMIVGGVGGRGRREREADDVVRAAGVRDMARYDDAPEAVAAGKAPVLRVAGPGMIAAVVDPAPACRRQRDGAFLDDKGNRLRCDLAVVRGRGDHGVDVVIARRRRRRRGGIGPVGGIVVIRHAAAAHVARDGGRLGAVPVDPALEAHRRGETRRGDPVGQRFFTRVVALQANRRRGFADVDDVARIRHVVIAALRQRLFPVRDGDRGLDLPAGIAPGLLHRGADTVVEALRRDRQRAGDVSRRIVAAGIAADRDGIRPDAVPRLIIAGDGDAGKIVLRIASDETRRVEVVRRRRPVEHVLVPRREREGYRRDDDRRGGAVRARLLAADVDRDSDPVGAAVGHVPDGVRRRRRALDGLALRPDDPIPLVGGRSVRRYGGGQRMLRPVVRAVIARRSGDGKGGARPLRVDRRRGGGRLDGAAAVIGRLIPAAEAVAGAGRRRQHERLLSHDVALIVRNQRAAAVISAVRDLGGRDARGRPRHIAGGVPRIKVIDAGRLDLSAHGHGCRRAALRRLPLVLLYACRSFSRGKGVLRHAAAGVGDLGGQKAVLAAGARRVTDDRRIGRVRRIGGDRDVRGAGAAQRRRRRSRLRVGKGYRARRADRPAGEGSAALFLGRERHGAVVAAGDQELLLRRRDRGDALAGVHRDERRRLRAARLRRVGGDVVRVIRSRRPNGERIVSLALRPNDFREIAGGSRGRPRRAGDNISVPVQRERVFRDRARRERASGGVIGDRRPRGDAARPPEAGRRGEPGLRDGEAVIAAVERDTVALRVLELIAEIVGARLAGRRFRPACPARCRLRRLVGGQPDKRGRPRAGIVGDRRDECHAVGELDVVRRRNIDLIQADRVRALRRGLRREDLAGFLPGRALGRGGGLLRGRDVGFVRRERADRRAGEQHGRREDSRKKSVQPIHEIRFHLLTPLSEFFVSDPQRARSRL